MQVCAGISCAPFPSSSAVVGDPPGLGSTLQLWLDSTDTATLFTTQGGGLSPADGDFVGRWEDKTSNSRDAVIADANRPILSSSGGKVTIYCNGTGKGLIVPSSALVACGSAFTIYVTALIDSGVSSGDYLTLIDGGAAGPIRTLALYFPNPFGLVFGGGGGAAFAVDLTSTSFGVIMARGTRTVTSWARRNAGTEYALSASTTAMAQPLGFGTNVTGGTNGWKGHYLSVLLYSADHNSSEQTAVRDWIQSKYGVS